MDSRILWFFLALALAVESSAAERKNRLIALFESDRPAIGIYVGAKAPNMARVMGTSGLDFVIVDMEHEIYDYREIHQFLLDLQDSRRYAWGWGAPDAPVPIPLVKVAHRATWDPRYDIAESFKMGPVMGVFVPFVESREDLERAISAARVPEQLQLEGVSPEERRDRLDVWPLNPKGELLVVAMIESEAGIRNAEEILSTPGLGVFHLTHVPDAESERLLRLCRERGVIAGRGETDPAKVKQWIDAGYRMIDLGWDYRMFQRELSRTLEQVRRPGAGDLK